jgi:hyperosmotically inducible periplasmic protein
LLRAPLVRHGANKENLMNHRFAALTLLIGASVACSRHNESAVNDPTDVSQTATTASEPALTPASSEGSPRQADSPSAAPRTAETTTTAHAAPAAAPSRNDQAAGIAPAPTRGDASRPAATPPATTPPVAPDNTKENERDRSAAAVTPTDQRENETDLKITQHIRQAVMADGSLSFTAKNVKIITAGGKVTLRGPVKTDAERSAIESAARKVAGVTQVDNQIEVKK